MNASSFSTGIVKMETANPCGIPNRAVAGCPIACATVVPTFAILMPASKLARAHFSRPKSQFGFYCLLEVIIG